MVHAESEPQHPALDYCAPTSFLSLLRSLTGLQSSMPVYFSYIPFPPDTILFKMFHGSELASEQNLLIHVLVGHLNPATT